MKRFSTLFCEDDVIQSMLNCVMTILLLFGLCSSFSYSAFAAASGGVLLGSNEDDDEEDSGGMVHDAVRLNIVAFETREKNFTFEHLITGTYAQLFQAFDGKANVIFLNRTPVIKDGDVLNIQEDALRMAGDHLSNDGLNCTFSFTNLSDEDSEFYSISGLCNMMYGEADGTRKVRAVVKSAVLSEANYGVNAWIAIYENKEAGIIIYADVDPK